MSMIFLLSRLLGTQIKASGVTRLIRAKLRSVPLKPAKEELNKPFLVQSQVQLEQNYRMEYQLSRLEKTYHSTWERMTI